MWNFKFPITTAGHWPLLPSRQFTQRLPQSSYAPGAIARSFVGADPARAQRFSSCSLLCLESSVAKETKRRFDDDAGPAFSLQGLKRMTANFLDIKRLFS